MQEHSPAIPRDSQNMRARWSTNASNGISGLLMGIYNQSNYRLLFNKLNLWDDSINSKIDENASKVITNYEGHMKQVNALAKGYGFFKALTSLEISFASILQSIIPSL